jgi:heme-degrading monooxygenase HmoA
MIKRIWRGWAASTAKAEAYQHFLQTSFLPAAHAIPGYVGAEVLRRRVGEEWEYMTITRFESMDAIRQFAGADPDLAHVAPEARELLSRWEERVTHYETAFEDAAPIPG